MLPVGDIYLFTFVAFGWIRKQIRGGALNGMVDKAEISVTASRKRLNRCRSRSSVLTSFEKTLKFKEVYSQRGQNDF